MFVIPKSCEELMRLQVVQYQSDPHAPWELALREASVYFRWLPDRPRRVIDLACGLGRTTVMVHKLCGLPDTIYYLMDRSEVSPVENWIGGWKPKQEEWCCDLEKSVEFCRSNMNGGILHPVEMDGKWDMKPLDLIISTLAIGFHWPLPPWLSELRRYCHKQTVAVFGTRVGINGPAPTGWRLKERVPSTSKQDFACFELE